MNPCKMMPKAINAVSVRVLVFYVAALLATMCVIPWNLVEKDSSPVRPDVRSHRFHRSCRHLELRRAGLVRIQRKLGDLPDARSPCHAMGCAGLLRLRHCPSGWADDTLQALLAIPVWFIVLGIVWAIVRRRSHRDDLEDGLTTS